MKNQKGITMTSLIMYIISFTIVIGIIGTITVFFDKNMEDINTSVGTSSEYNKFNLYMLNLTKNGYTIDKQSTESAENPYITFGKIENNVVSQNTFVKIGNILYYNKIKLCENVNDFSIDVSTGENGKTIVSTNIKIGEKDYVTNYTLE